MSVNNDLNDGLFFHTSNCMTPEALEYNAHISHMDIVPFLKLESFSVPIQCI